MIAAITNAGDSSLSLIIGCRNIPSINSDCLESLMRWFPITIAALLLASVAESVDAQDKLPGVDQQFAASSDTVPDFQKHVVPLLGRLGCSSAKCHGSFQGQAGFRLSLFGFDFSADHAALTAKSSSSDAFRIKPGAPEQSLLLRKATNEVPHEGGQRLLTGSWEHNLLTRWVKSGAAGTVQAKPPEPTEASPADLFFREQVQPILETHCFECHGFGNRKGGLQLTSRDNLLDGGDSGSAAVPGRPDDSLIIQAVHYDGLEMPPSGRLQKESIALLEQWIKEGAHWPKNTKLKGAGADAAQLASLQFDREEILFSEAGQRQTVHVIAKWVTGEQEDVTGLVRFRTNNDVVAVVDGSDIVAGEPGDTHVIAFYDNGVAAIPVIRPFTEQSPERPKYSNPIDTLVDHKLQRLGLTPSAPCTDTEFLRRVSIDLTGTLPAPDEVRDFRNDIRADKRERLIEELLKRPAYAAWWANRLCDYTGCSPTAFGEQQVLEVGHSFATQWYDWIYRRVADNVPYDRLVEGIVLARSRTDGQSQQDFAREMSAYVRNAEPADFSKRHSMPHYWTRTTIQEDSEKALAFAHSFLGIQLQCAQCHKHPFDQWTQHDFNEFSRFFAPLRTQGNISFPGFAAAQRGSIVNWPQLAIGDLAGDISLLRSGVVTVESGSDPRQPLMDWIREPSNPWFARAFVNRVWAGYFHTGIVEPPDQFTPANPPSNGPLLQWLTQAFIDQKYDIRWLHRQIVTSQTYQRSWRPNKTNTNDRRNFSRAIPRRIPAEVLYDGLKQVTASTQGLESVRTNLERRASGHLSMRMAGTHAMKVFGKPARAINCDCERVNQPTLLQAVFLQNDPLIRMRLEESDWLFDIEDAIADGVKQDREDLINQVWLRTVGRLPSESDRERAFRHLDSVDSLPEGLRDLVWAMINTREFLLNH